MPPDPPPAAASPSAAQVPGRGWSLARSWRAALLSFLLLGGVGTVLVVGALVLGHAGPDTLGRWMGAGLSGPAGALAAVVAFTLLAFIGAPQIVLVAAAVVAFGAWPGFWVSWVGTMVSSVVGFAVGRRFGAGLVRARFSSGGLSRFIAMVGRNGFVASAAVRLIPSAPFIVVNVAAGSTPMSPLAFLAGTAVGSTPKIALTAFAGRQLASFAAGRGSGLGHALTLAEVAALWVGAGLVVRWWMKRRDAATAKPAAD